jgi:hypothetical protein
MATPEEIAAAREAIIAPDNVIGLILDLRKQGNTEAASLLEWYIDERSTLVQALEGERDFGTRMAQQVDELVARLNRIGDHLRTLTIYAEGDNDHAAPSDPWPEPKRGRK